MTAYIVINYFEYLRKIPGGTTSNFYSSTWPIYALFLIAPLLILIGLKKGSNLNNKSLFLVLFPSLLAIPLIMVIIKSLNLYRLGI
jgi:hypothetical protein